MIEEMVRKHPLLMILKRFVSSNLHHQMSLRDGTVTIILRNNSSPWKHLPLRSLPLCHHRCQSWKNMVSLCALWYLWLSNRKGHQSPTDPFRETGITTETSENEKRTVSKPNLSSQASWKRISHPAGDSSVKAERGQIF